MFVHSKQFVTNKVVDREQIQPNAVDIRIEKVWNHTYHDTLVLNRAGTVYKVDKPALLLRDNHFTLLPRNTYEFDSDIEVEIPEGYVGWVIPRSTLIRNGIFVTSGLYDSGYKGTVGSIIVMNNTKLVVEKGARIAQFVTAKAETLHLYNGQYQKS